MQRSEEWHKARCGIITASRFKDVIGKGRNGYLKARADYMEELVLERLTGEPNMSSWGDSGRYGETMEEYARLAYEAETGVIVKEMDFVIYPGLPYIGCSPDGFIGEDGGLEIKCPSSLRVQLRTVKSKQMPDEHKPQVQGNMWITGRAWWDFVSFDGRMPENLRLFIQRIERDNAYINMLEKEIKQFEKETNLFLDELLAA